MFVKWQKNPMVKSLARSVAKSAAYATAAACAAVPTLFAPALLHAEGRITTGYNTYGYPGLIDMPTAHSRPDGELAVISSYFAGQTRNTLTFQVAPRLSGSFRYSSMRNIAPVVGGPVTPERLDRSFSIHYRFVDETAWRPAVAVGLNDFLGTGLYSSEYFVASKTLGRGDIRVSGGIGWGRLAGTGNFRNPLAILGSSFENRPARAAGFGGQVDTGRWFQGDAALFGGVEWQATDKLSLALEYSSDAYPNESPFAFDHKMPVNVGATYRINKNFQVSAHYLYGSEFGIQLTGLLNPKTPPLPSGLENAPPPVVPRSALRDLGWPEDVEAATDLRRRVAAALSAQGIRLYSFRLDGDTARVGIENDTYRQEAQAVGRTARALTGLLPAGIDTIVIVPVTASGLPVTELRIARSDLETLEHELQNDWLSYNRTEITSPTIAETPVPERFPYFDATLKPYISPSLFDPDDPVRADLGAELAMTFQPARGIEISGAVRKKIAGNLSSSTRPSTSVLPHVRSDFNIYDRTADPALATLTGAYYFKPSADLYGRVTLGYLEPMFGGISTELLWKPVDSRFAVGVEANYVKQRDFDQRFGFQNYDVITGHVSAYWDIGNGYHGQIDAGRYLAGDWGATFALDREFNNGWRVGAYATFTNVPFATFGEGSFDKGLRITIPIDWLAGEPTKDEFTTTIKPVNRDGGARLDVGGRLYERVRSLQEPGLRDGWGRFWR